MLNNIGLPGLLLIAVVVLVLFGRHSYLPPALGLPYHRGER
jgi:Sec-independent protein translocase protein TatA